MVEVVDVREVEEDRVVFCLLLTTPPPPPAPLPKGMQVLAEGSTRLPPTRIPDPFRSEVDALLSFQFPFGRSLLSEPALLPATPLLTFRLPVLRYMLPSRLPTAYPSRFTEGSARPKGLFLTIKSLLLLLR